MVWFNLDYMIPGQQVLGWKRGVWAGNMAGVQASERPGRLWNPQSQLSYKRRAEDTLLRSQAGRLHAQENQRNLWGIRNLPD